MPDSVLERFFSFDIFIARYAVTVIYILGVIFLFAIGISIFIWGRTSPFSYKTMSEAYTVGILIIIFGNIIWRLVCETVAVIFKINESLISIDEKIDIK